MPDAAVAMLETRGGSVLLIRRAERAADPWSGHWSFPGGRCEPEDANPLATALRELEEECGIRLTPEHLEAAFTPTLARRRTPPFVLVAPFLFRVDRELSTVLDPNEAAEARWVPLDLLRDSTRHALRAVPGVPPHMLFPAIDLGAAVPLWGFTYRLITDWLKLVPGAGARVPAPQQVLEFLLGRGLTLRSGWKDQSATVDGVIPVDDVLAHFSTPAGQIPMVNMMEVRQEYVCIVGLDFEKYFVYGETGR